MIDSGDLHHPNVSEKKGGWMKRDDVPSIRILMNNICIALSGLLNPNIVLSVMSVRAAHAVLSWNDKKFWILWNIDLPRINKRRNKDPERR